MLPTLDTCAYVVTPGGTMCWEGQIAELAGAEIPTTLDDWLARVPLDDRERVRETLSSRRGGGKLVFYRIAGADGRLIDVSDSGRVLDDGSSVGSITDLAPLMASRIAGERARKSALELERIAHAGYFELDLSSGVASCSDGVYRILGEDARGPTMRIDELATLVLPEDRESLCLAVQACRLGARDCVALAIRARGNDGRALHLELQIEGTHSGGEPSVVGTVRDLSAHHRDAEALRRVELHQERILAELPLVLWSVDRERRLVMIAGRTHDLALDPHELVGRRFDELGVAPGASTRLDRALTGESFTETLVVRGRSLRAHWFPHIDRTGAIVGAGGFSLDLTEHEVIERERREADAHIRTIAESVDAVVWISTADLSRVLYVSPSFERVFGIPAGDILTNPARWIETVHPDDRERVFAAASERPWHQDQIHRVCWPDGTVRWVDVKVRPILDNAGNAVSSVGIAADVTDTRDTLEGLQRTEVELRRSLAEKEALLREVHHRVRNNLQLIQSLLSLQGRGVTDPAARRVLRDSQRRVQALALVHESLYQADLSAVALGGYLRRLLEALGAVHSHGTARVELEFSVDVDGTTPVQIAIHVGIVVAELVANAFEHAFVDGRAGHVQVAASVVGDHLQIDVADDGVGVALDFSVDRCATLGLTLVSTVLATAGGVLSVQREAGTVFRVRLPIVESDAHNERSKPAAKAPMA